MFKEEVNVNVSVLNYSNILFSKQSKDTKHLLYIIEYNRVVKTGLDYVFIDRLID